MRCAGSRRGAAAFFRDISGTAARGPITGRLVVIVAKREQPEPRLTVSPQGPAIFAIDIEALQPGQTATVDERALGYPMRMAELPAGEYFVQAVVNVYEQVRRSDGHTIRVKINDGQQETFTVAAGNLYSPVQRVRIEENAQVRLEISNVIPAAPQPKDTEWVKRLRIQSDKLTKFWGRPVFVHATVLLPRGYTTQTGVRYPAVYTFGHNVPFSFSTDSARTRNIGQINPVTGVETGYDFYKAWNSNDFPRFLAISFQQQTPYFPDSYSINSANNGPYGAALVEEIIPALEKQFRIVNQPYARLVEGASTGGWQSLALQLHYPDYSGGAWVLQPDPIDFRRYLLVNIYEDENAFTLPLGQHNSIERPFRRTVEGQVVWTMRQMSLFEEVLGTRGRSSYQLGGWEAVYGPVGADGYPKPLWDKLTGKIDREVANYMRDQGYDLRHYAQTNWTTLGPKLQGKLHFFAGDMDDFYLNLAVYQFEEFLKGTSNPRSDAQFTYGRPTKGHSWHAFPWAELVRRMGAHVAQNTPKSDGQ
ncbi:MAG: alpha/beta hydrolase-fold protein [Longimicrobiales bacterium]